MEFKDVISKYKFEGEGLVWEVENYILRFEGYAYVLYKKIVVEVRIGYQVLKHMAEHPVAHFKDAKKLDIFLEILFDKFEDGSDS